jgi:putative addiction module killer protein/probable addiction module antidote protein
MVEVRHYTTASGKDVFETWLASLKDKATEARIAARIDRLRAGNFGDCKPLGGGVWELRIDFGPRYRVYYAMIGQSCVLLMSGGDKRTSGGRHREGSRASERLQTAEHQTMKHKASISHDEVMRKKLKNDPEFAMEYVKAAMEDTEEPQVLLIALRRIAEARGGLAKIAKAAGIQRESLYRALSRNGNPRLSTLLAVTKAIGLTLTVKAA